MPALRLFVAAELPEAVRAELAALAPDDAAWRALPAESLHVTLAFLGELPASEPVVAALAGVSGVAAPARLDGMVALPRRRPRVLAARVESPGLMTLQAEVARELVAAGLYAPEDRPFLPHVTVARTRRGGRARVVGLEVPATVFPIGSIALFRSEPNSRYTALWRSTLPG